MAASGGRIPEALARLADEAYRRVTVMSTLIMFACVSWKGGTVGRLTVFLTGATEVIGSRVVSLLVAAAWRAWCSGSPTSTEPIPTSPGMRYGMPGVAGRRRWGPPSPSFRRYRTTTPPRPVRRREFTDALAAAMHVPPPRFFPTWVARLAGSLGETLARSQRIANRKLRGASPWAPRYPSVVEGWQAVLADLPR